MSDHAETMPAQVEEALPIQDVVMEQTEAEQVEVEKQVPLSALQKERKKRQEAEMRAQMLEEQQQRAQSQPPKEEEDAYESLTKKEFRQETNLTKQEIIRDIEERAWQRANPEKYDIVNEKLPKLLKLKPNLAYAIANSLNRYEDAWDMLNAFDKEQSRPQSRSVQQKNTPGSPSSVPKAAGINETIDVMSMSDKEFAEYRAAKRRRR